MLFEQMPTLFYWHQGFEPKLLISWDMRQLQYAIVKWVGLV